MNLLEAFTRTSKASNCFQTLSDNARGNHYSQTVLWGARMDLGLPSFSLTQIRFFSTIDFSFVYGPQHYSFILNE